MLLTLKPKIWKLGAASVAAMALSACGIDGIDLNGKVFDAVGLNTGSVKQGDPKLRERAPLVVPPGLEALPVPGSAAPPEADAVAGLQDHDAKRNISKEELERRQREFCDKNYSVNKAYGDETVDMIEGPAGPCRGSIFSAIKNMNKSDDTE